MNANVSYAIEFDGVSFRRQEHLLLDGVSIRLDEPRIAIVGPNGAGKTTFARLANGLLTPTQGEVRVGGVSTAKEPRNARRKVALVFQDPDTQIVMPTVEEDLAFGLLNIGVPKREATQRAAAWLHRHGLGAKRDAPAHLLSGGEKKLLSILSVLIMEPQTVIFDEPFTFLDLATQRQIAALIDGLACNVIVITHDLEYAQRFDRALYFDGGSIREDGPARAVIAAYRRDVDACSPSTSPATRDCIAPVPA
jgi:biotin transport system ATP-binding protein